MNVYDFDGTIYDGDSTVDFFLFAIKRKPTALLRLPKQFWGFVLYGLKQIDKTKLKEYFYSFLPAVDGESLLEAFWDQNQHKIFSWYPQMHQPEDIVISASPEFLLRPICRRLGIERLIASKVDIRTGKYTGVNCRGKEKVRRLEAEYQITEIDNFYSDSHSDLPLAKIARKAYLIKQGAITEWN
jgi:HAD superfamily phosphoserine phosphatase-like hydrolase